MAAWIRPADEGDESKLRNRRLLTPGDALARPNRPLWFLHRAEVFLAMMQRHGNDIGGKLNAVAELLGAQVAITIILVDRQLTHSLLVNAPSLGPPAKPVFEEAA